MYEFARAVRRCQVAAAEGRLQTAGSATETESTKRPCTRLGEHRGAGDVDAHFERLSVAPSRAGLLNGLNALHSSPSPAFVASAHEWMMTGTVNGATAQAEQRVTAPCFVPAAHKCRPHAGQSNSGTRMCLPGYYVTGSEGGVASALAHLVASHPFNHL